MASRHLPKSVPPAAIFQPEKELERFLVGLTEVAFWHGNCFALYSGGMNRHMAVSRWIGLAVLVVLAAGLGCPLPFEGGWILLEIDAAAAPRAVAVSDFTVTGLGIELRGPTGDSLRTIDWEAAEGPRSYHIRVEQAGEHEIRLMHFGDDPSVQAVETLALEVRAGRVTVVAVVPGGIGLVRVEERREE